MSRLIKNNNIQKEINNESNENNISSKIIDIEKRVRDTMGYSNDVAIENVQTIKEKALIVYIDGLVNKNLIDRDIINPLKSTDFDGNVLKSINCTYMEVNEYSVFVNKVLNGSVGIFYEDTNKAILIELQQWEQRSVTEPEAEAVIRGPKEGFTENIRTNTALIRRKIKTPKLIIENYTLGRLTNTSIALVYIEGIVNQDVLKEARNRLSNIDTDVILESGSIEQYIEENSFSPISGIGITQKPDNVGNRISEGRIAILCDGTPHVLTIPELFLENINSSEDYYNRILYSAIIRVLRVIGLFFTVVIPGLSTAVITYHQEMIPSVFLTNIISASQKIPFPAAVEVFVLTLMFELLKEAGTRLPKAVGSAITIVGSLIIGDAAVNAGIVSAPMVIIVALTAVTSFMVPNLSEFVLVYRAIFWLLGSTMGLIGIGTAFFIMLTHLISTHSFGIPILSSFSKNEMKDFLIRFPIWAMKYRPASIAGKNIKRR